MECLKNAIGFTRSESQCFTGEFEAEAKVSTSGLYMDELPESSHILKAVKGTTDAGTKMNVVFDTARKQAISALKEKVFEELGLRYSVRTLPYSGLVGQNSFNSALNISANIFGAAIQAKPLNGAVMTLKRLWLSLNQTGTFTVNVFKARLQGNFYVPELVTSIEAGAVAGKATATELIEPLELPLMDDSSNLLHYLLLIDRTVTGVLPMNNKASCGCANQAYVEQWVVQGGITGNSLDSLQHTLKTSGDNYINGVTFEADIRCTDANIICASYINNPFVRTAIDHALLYEAVSALLKGITRSDAVNRYALTKREQMSVDAQIMHNKFKSRMQWIAENLEMGTNSCFICNTNSDPVMYKTGIIF